MDIENMSIEKATERCKALTNPEQGCWIGISNQKAIETVLSELEKKEAIINEMAKKLVEAHSWFYSEFDNFSKEDFIKYFTNKVTDINVGE